MKKDDEKITNIKYKQMDNDPEIKHVTNQMERMFFGEKGVGLMDALGLNPGKIQKYLDESKDYQTIDGEPLNRDEFKNYIKDKMQFTVKNKNFNLSEFMSDLRTKNDITLEQLTEFIHEIQTEMIGE